MYVEEIKEDSYHIYINNKYFTFSNWNDKEEISKNVKELVFKLDQIYHLQLSGFYKMKIYLNKLLGMMIEMEKLEDFGIKIKTIDLKIVIYLNNDFLIRVNDIEMIKNCPEIYMLDDLYYGKIEGLSEKEILFLTEWGTFIYGDELERIKKKGTKLSIKKV